MYTGCHSSVLPPKYMKQEVNVSSDNDVFKCSLHLVILPIRNRRGITPRGYRAEPETAIVSEVLLLVSWCGL